MEIGLCQAGEFCNTDLNECLLTNLYKLHSIATCAEMEQSNA